MKTTSYQKLKNKIKELEKEKSLLVNDIYNLIKEPDTTENLICKIKWNVQFDTDKLIWSGENETTEFKGLM